jgi:hypothetical protein
MIRALVDEAVAAAREGDYRLAYELLGEAMHYRQDRHWHDWCDQSGLGHSGLWYKHIAAWCLVFNPVTGPVFSLSSPGECVKKDLGDVFIAHRDACQAEVLWVMREFERRLQQALLADAAAACQLVGALVGLPGPAQGGPAAAVENRAQAEADRVINEMKNWRPE